MITNLLLLPGLLCDRTLWSAQIKALDGLATIQVADNTKDSSLVSMAERALATAPASFALAGLSMGGYLALEIMRQAPQRVERLALLDTSPYPDSPEQTGRRQAFIQMSEQGEFKGVTQRLLPMLIHKDRLADQKLCNAIFKMAENTGKDAFIRQQQAIMGRPDARPWLKHIKCKTMVLCGRQDALTPLHIHQEMAENIEGARLSVIEECGHLSPMERPNEVNREMEDWLLA